ncbi:MAG: hypothetical protein R3357_11330 [Burkholderiales bacterium]|nr:hypothetical protein [Burkholderiales bacterium]
MGQAAAAGEARFALERHIGRIAAARRTSTVLEAVRAYLGSWPSERVERLQRADAGWAPFDERQQPFAFYSAADVENVYRDVHQHCTALRKSGLALSPELLELDWVLLLAHLGLQRSRAAQLHGVGPRAS